MNYEKDMYIDEDALDLEWLEQPALMRKYSRTLADLEHEYDEAKEELELIRAELDRDIRKDPEEFDVVKITETVIQNTIIMQERYEKGLEKFLNTKHEMKTARGVISSIEQRKSALENLVKLHGQNYFAGPAIPRDLREERELKEKEIQKNIGEKLKRTKK